MDFRSITNGLSKSIGRCRDKADVGAIGTFRGVLSPAFTNWIGAHWRFLEARLFKAVPLHFYRPTNPFGQMSWPQPRETRSRFVFSPNIQVTFRLAPVNNRFFERNILSFGSVPHSRPAEQSVSRSFAPFGVASADKPFFEKGVSTLHFLPRSRPAERSVAHRYMPFGFAATGNMFFADQNYYFQSLLPAAAQTHATRELWSSFLQSKEQPWQVRGRPLPFEPPAPGSGLHSSGLHSSGLHKGATNIFRNRQILFGTITGILPTRRIGGPLARGVAPLHLTISSAVQGWALFFGSGLRQSFHTSLWQSKDLRYAGNVSFALTFNRLVGTTTLLKDLKMASGKRVDADKGLGPSSTARRSETNVALRQSFLTQLHLSQFRPRPASRERSFTNVVQKFIAPKAAGPEAAARQIQYFGLSPDISFARSDSSQMQGVINALRDFRPPANETRIAAPQLPSIAELTSQVRRELERELRIERERRGR
jgi:hypothetical protein